MRNVNIVFQAEKGLRLMDWKDVPIVYTLKNVPFDKDIKEIAECVSALYERTEVRVACLYLNEPLTSEQAVKSPGRYYQATKID